MTLQLVLVVVSMNEKWIFIIVSENILFVMYYGI